jgi:hypothetical protein
MTITPIEDVAFDDATTFAMGEAFDRTCESIRIIGSSVPVCEIIAKQIIDAAKSGERDPARLYEQALIIFGIVDLHYINELHSDLRGVTEGWYAIDERGNLLLGPFSNRENCLTGISQSGTDECRK